MKKILLLVVISILHYNHAKACDVCGCANGASFFGILPQSHFKFGGLRYQNRTFESHYTSNLLRSEENFQSIEPWLRLYPIKKTQLVLMASYQLNTQTALSSGVTKTIEGLGDVSALAHYNVINTVMDSTTHQFDHIWLLGGGIKLPTGKYDYVMSSEVVANPNFQLGTGSVDYTISSIYTIRRGNYGINTDLSYKINGTNSNGYKFANKSRAIINVFGQYQLGALTLLPNIGIFAEYGAYDLDNGRQNRFSGGYIFNGMLGAELYFKKITAGFSLQLPISSNLAGNELRLKNSFMGHVTLLF